MNQNTIDTLPYRIFNKLKEKFSVKTILLTEHDMAVAGLRRVFKDHREYIIHKFATEGVEVYRFAHDYRSLDTSDPKMGLVFMANDSVVTPGMEVHALIGHNARYMPQAKEKVDGL